MNELLPGVERDDASEAVETLAATQPLAQPQLAFEIAPPMAPPTNGAASLLTRSDYVRRKSETRLETLKRLMHEELGAFHLRLVIAAILLWPLPIHVGGRLRTSLLRLIGFRLGRGTIMSDLPTFTGTNNLYRNLSVGESCWVNIGCVLDLAAPVTIGNNVMIGHEVMVLTTSHEIGSAAQRASNLHVRPVTIGSSVWLGARSVVLPGVTIGHGAVVAAGALVNADVPANTLVAGVPARVIKSLI